MVLPLTVAIMIERTVAAIATGDRVLVSQANRRERRVAMSIIPIAPLPETQALHRSVAANLGTGLTSTATATGLVASKIRSDPEIQRLALAPGQFLVCLVGFFRVGLIDCTSLLGR